MGHEWLAVQEVCDLLISVLLFWRADNGQWGMNGWLAVQRVCDLLISVLLFWRADSGQWHEWLAVQLVCDLFISVLLFWRADSGQWGMNGWLCRGYVTCSFLYCCFG